MEMQRGMRCHVVVHSEVRSTSKAFYMIGSERMLQPPAVLQSKLGLLIHSKKYKINEIFFSKFASIKQNICQ